MNHFLQIILLLVFIVLGVLFAIRWVVAPPPRIQKFPRWFRMMTLILCCWFGTFVFFAAGRKVGYLVNDGVAYDEGAEVPYDVMYDGVGDNILALFLGWASGPIFLVIGKAIAKDRTEQDAPHNGP